MFWERYLNDTKLQFCHLQENSSLMLSSFSANKEVLMAILMQWTRVENCDLATFTAYTMYCCNAKVWIHTNKFTDSITSKKTSFLRYLTPSPLQDTAFVKATGGLGAPTSNLWPSWVIYLVNKVEQDELKIWYTRNSLWSCSLLFKHCVDQEDAVCEVKVPITSRTLR